jgi:NADPH-dependent curcumin reductase CurA
MMNRQIVLRPRPVSPSTIDDFELVVARIVEPVDGGAPVRDEWMFLAPCMRGRMQDVRGSRSLYRSPP